MVVHQKTSTYYYTRNRMEIGTAYRLRTPKTGLGEGGGNTTSIKISIARYNCKYIDCKHIA